MSGLGRLRWRCRRGMRELDQLLTRYLDCHYQTAPVAERQAFEKLLELSDPQLWGLLSHRESAPDPMVRCVIERIIDRADD